MEKNFFLIFLLSSLFFSQCSKDNLEFVQECISIQELTDALGQPLFPASYPYYELAYFNPNNSDEILCRYADGVTPGFDLVKYNLKTKEKEIIYTGRFSKTPRWGKNGWILLNIWDSLGFNIYKIRSNGDDLTPLTSGSNYFDPEWNITSDKFICQLGYTSPTKYLMIDQDGLFIDTLSCGGGSGMSWQHLMYMASSNFRGFAFYDPFDCENSYFYELENIAQSLNGAEWLDNERVFWCHTTGMYITNIVTKETEIIRETCNAHCYQRPTYALDIDKVIVEKLERIKDNETEGRAIISLVMMNPDGTEEEIIELD